MHSLGVVGVVLVLQLASAAPSAACDAERDATIRWIKEVAEQADRNSAVLTSDLTMVSRAGEPLQPVSVVVDLARKDTFVDGVLAPDLKKALAQKFERLLDLEIPKSVVLRIDRTAEWSRVVAVAKVLRDSGAPVSLGFVDPSSAKPPGPSSIDADLKRIESLAGVAEKFEALGKLTPKVARTCTDFTRAFAQGDLGQGVKPYADSLATALTQCGCQVDLPAFAAVYWRIVNVAPVMTGVPLKLSSKGKRLKLPSTMTWAVAVEQLLAVTAGGQPVDLTGVP